MPGINKSSKWWIYKNILKRRERMECCILQFCLWYKN